MFPEAEYQSRECEECGAIYLWPAYGGKQFCGNCSDIKREERIERNATRHRERMAAVRRRQREQWEAEHGTVPVMISSTGKAHHGQQAS